MIKRAIFACLLSCTVAPVLAQSKHQVIDAFVKALVKNQDFSGSVLVIENDTVVYENAFGYTDPARKTLNTPGTRFPIASITKLFTATAILQLKEKGLLNLADPVARHLPGFPYPDVRLKHLLSHTSGMPPYNAFFDTLRLVNPDTTFTNKDFLPGILANPKPLVYEPGSKGNYDNINYLVLALVVEKVSGMVYQDYIKQNILQPAGMTETEFLPLPVQFNGSTIQNFAYPHVFLHAYDPLPVKSNTIPYVRNYWKAYGFSGFADYASTTGDLWKFDQALYRGRLLHAQTLQEAFVPVRLNSGEANTAYFGLGWEIEKDSTLGKLVYHSGAAMGLSSNLMHNNARHQLVILFDNSHYNAHENALKLMKLLNGVGVENPKKSIARIYGQTLVRKGPAAAHAQLETLRKDTAQYYLSEDEMNTLGYDFMGTSNPYRIPMQRHYQRAVETLKINVRLFPGSWNAYDSYAEALAAAGQKEEAIRMYRKSIELNPGNEGGKKWIEKLRK